MASEAGGTGLEGITMAPKDKAIQRITIYTRVSFEARRKGKSTEETSPERQEQRCRAYAAAQGWDDAEVTVYSDRGVSAFSGADRPGWSKVVADVASGTTDAVLVFALDRAGRNTIRILQFVEHCREHDVAFVSVTQNIDTAGPYGMVVLAVLAAVAEVESWMKRERGLSKHIEMAEAGRYAGSYRVFGYTRQMEQVPTEVDAVRHAVEDYLNGASLRSIAAAWNAAGLRTTPGNEWDITGLRRLLENPILAGDRVHVGRDAKGKKRDRSEGTVHKGSWKPILTRSTWKKVVARLAESEERQVARRSDRYLLTGLLRCTICGNYLVGRPSGGVRRYVCIRSGRNHLGIASEPVETVVSELVLRTSMKRTVVRDPAELSAPLLAELDALEAKLASWAVNAAEAKLSPEEIVAGRAPIAAERDRVQAELDKLAEEPQPMTRDQARDELWRLRNSSDWEAVVRARVDHVDVKPVGRGGNRTPAWDRCEVHWRPGVEFPAGFTDDWEVQR